MNLISRIALFVAPVVLVSLIACSSTTADDEEVCKDGTQCVCKESCSKKCESADGSGCQFTCQTGTCSFDCPGGSCQVVCDGTSNCNINCPKGGCRVTGSAGKTDLKCGNTGTCMLTCSGTESCTVDGEPGTGGGDIPGMPGGDDVPDGLAGDDGE